MLVKNFVTIRLGVGLGDLAFGANYADVERYLGKADSDAENNGIHIWYFRKLGISAYFDAEEGYALTGFEAYNRGSILWGQKIFNMEIDEILVLFNEKEGGLLKKGI